MNIAKLVKDLIHKQVWSAGELDCMDVGKLLNLFCSFQPFSINLVARKRSQIRLWSGAMVPLDGGLEPFPCPLPHVLHKCPYSPLSPAGWSNFKCHFHLARCFTDAPASPRRS